MRTIQISDEDYEFLKNMQHELNTQTNGGKGYCITGTPKLENPTRPERFQKLIEKYCKED